MPAQGFESIREALPIVGKRVVEVTCDDWEEVCEQHPEPEERASNVYVHFDDGSTLTIVLTPETPSSGFSYDGFEEPETPTGDHHGQQ
jgi:hypothetical protein